MRPIFFTHVMKTGGVSVTDRIRGEIGEERAYPGTGAGAGVALIAQKSLPEYVLSLDDERRREIALYSVHQPAWVAFVVAPDACRITVLRDPVERTISHLRQLAGVAHIEADMEAIYADDQWRRRLVNYQSQIFALRESDGPTDPPPPPTEAADEDDKREFVLGLQRLMGTAIAHPIAIDDSAAARARETLDRYDAVGTTDDIDGFARTVGRITGLDLSGVAHKNRTSSPAPVSATLRRAIEADNEADLALYHHARTRADAY